MIMAEALFGLAFANRHAKGHQVIGQTKEITLVVRSYP